jgi:hypothetical protein
MGMGPMTGRAAGYCAGYGVPGDTHPIAGRGYGFWGGGRGFSGRGRGHRNWFYATGLPFWARRAPYVSMPVAGAYAPISQEQELVYLKDQAEYLTTSMNEIQKRISELEDSAKK